MKITLYKSKAEKNQLDKTKQLNIIMQLQGVLKAPCSVTNPIVDIEYSILHTINIGEVVSNNDTVVYDNNVPVIYENISEILDANYCYIEEFNRYYFIEDITIMNNKINRLTLKVDVLMSFKDKILEQTAYVGRNEFLFNPSLVDTERITSVDSNIQYYKLNTKLYDDYHPSERLDRLFFVASVVK